jgi:hypothetical protein
LLALGYPRDLRAGLEGQGVLFSLAGQKGSHALNRPPPGATLRKGQNLNAIQALLPMSFGPEWQAIGNGLASLGALTIAPCVAFAAAAQ